MSDLMERAIASLKEVSAERRDEIAWAVIELLEAPSPITLTDDEKAAIDEAEAEIERGEVATEDEVRAIWAKYGL